jgi:hypothetical protein
MDKNKAQSNRRQPQKKVSDVGRAQRNRAHHRTSLAKSIGKIRKGEQETPIVAIQQVHLLRKQKAFLVKQAFVFEKKAQTVREQVKELEAKIKIQKSLATKLVDALEEEYVEVEDSIPTNHSKPEKNMKEKTRKFFRMGY